MRLTLRVNAGCLPQRVCWLCSYPLQNDLQQGEFWRSFALSERSELLVRKRRDVPFSDQKQLRLSLP